MNTTEKNETLLQLVRCSRTYMKGAVRVHALQDVTFSMQEGEIVSLIGRSGSGKSTLLNLVGGLDRPDHGEIRIRNENLTQMNRNGLAMHRRFTVGMIFQSFNLIPSRTALENVSLALAFGGRNRTERRAIAERLLESVGLRDRMDHKPGELSGGECQRVAIARALANSPCLLLADEPTGNLDSRTSAEILELLGRLNNQGVSILMVTHDEAGAEKISHRIIQLLDGKIMDEKQCRRDHETG
ncbi:ABC transporter ATP-binding protein [bacterium]|nr:ABC transporter ATP-binding protein [bacterium]